jgi:putative nucleotidyltransferase with HDIG domain
VAQICELTSTAGAARAVLAEARECEGAGHLADAVHRYDAAARLARDERVHDILAEALRRLAAVKYKCGDIDEARVLAEQSQRVARELGDDLLAAEALNTLGVIEMMSGSLEHARDAFREALKLGGSSRQLRARVEQNLGILANIQGSLDEALAWYGRSLEEYRAAGDDHGCALAFNNLGMVSADRQLFDEADRYFRETAIVAERTGDTHLRGLALANHAEVHVARQRYDDALHCAEEALRVFEQLGARGAKSEAYRVVGMVYRDTGRPLLAEARLRAAIETAVSAGAVLAEAEASREMAALYQTMGRNEDALGLLTAAHRLFHRLDARVDLVNVAGKLAALQSAFLAVVREWGSSIESSDSYTFGHCERVADSASAVACALGLDEQAQLAIRLGAYLHDLGKVRVPHEILNKTGPLTDAEFGIVKMHPVWGTEMLDGVEFPWPIKPIIRWHHEKYDGTGYPDALRGDEIPLSAQIVGVADVYDALTTTRAYRTAMSHTDALVEIARCRGWWSPPVYDAALRALGSTSAAGPASHRHAA